MAEKSSNAQTAAGPPASSSSATTRPNVNTASPNPYSSLANVTASQIPAQSYQPYTHLNWQNAWTMNSLYTGGGSITHQNSIYAQQSYAPYQSHYHSMPVPPVPSTAAGTTHAATSTQNTMDVDDKPKLSSTPPPPHYEHWDEAFREFLRSAGLTQTLKGFECDMLVMSSKWEQTGVQFALETLIKALRTTKELRSQKGKTKELVDESSAESKEQKDDRSLEERKLDYVRLANGEKPRSQTSINKEISTFLARNRARNDASNRSEFLLSLSEKRKHLQDLDDPPEGDTVSSCARTDARTIDRDAQMKYDIAKNDEGPLRRTKVKKDEKHSPPSKPTTHVETPFTTGNAIVVPIDQELLPIHHPGAHERLGNIETHLAVRYVPSLPRTLWARLKSLEDHIVKLEKDYPPWAALQFNQPNRGWPPPPRATPIIVPPHLRSSDPDTASTTKAGTPDQQGPSSSSLPTLGNQKIRNTKSSLQRAIMERLEVQQAMEEKMDSGS